jgi:RNA polymerase sigma-70 factor (ECF subfamily)
MWIPMTAVTKRRRENPSARTAVQPAAPRSTRRQAEAPLGEEYAALLREATAGDRAAMERLLMRAQETAYRFSVTVCGHGGDAEDVMQEALIKTYRYASSIRDPEAFRPWLYRTVRNACLMHRRLRVDEPRHVQSLDELVGGTEGGSVLSVASPGRDPEALALNSRLRRRLAQAFGELPASHRIVVFLREMEGLSTKEVADVMGISEANVKTRLHRARVALQQKLGDA